MKFRSHKWRLTLWATLITGTSLGVVLYGVFLLMARSQADAVDDMLRSVLDRIAVGSEQNGEWHDPEELASLYPGLSVAVFVDGRTTTSYGVRLPLLSGAGTTTISGRLVRYRSIRRDGQTVVAAVDWEDQVSDQHRMLLAFGIIWPITVGLVAWVARAAANATFKPLLRMSTEAERMAADTGSRLPVPEDEEFGLLARRLNGFLERLEKNVAAQERFASDAAHEMRTPLTVIRGHFETALLRPRTIDEYAAVLRLGVSEVERLSALVTVLLESAVTERKAPKAIDCSSIVREVSARWAERFVSAGVQLHLDLEAEPLRAEVWESELVCILDNLLSNALRFSPAGSVCELIGRRAESVVVIEVRDQGKGVPEEGRIRIFERFVRLDEGRSRDEGGFGIGLAVCRTIVERRGGKIEQGPNSPRGSVFRFTLPSPKAGV